MIEPWRLYSIFERLRPNRRQRTVPERHSSQDWAGPRLEARAKGPVAAGHWRRAGCASHPAPYGTEFDLRSVADIRYALRRSASFVMANPFRGRVQRPRCEKSGCGLAGRFGVARSTGNSAFCIVVALAACMAQPAFALDPRYPDWPCQQLKVPGISIASVWAGPSIEGIDKTEPTDPKLAELVARLAARRTPMEDARKLVAEFIVGTSDEKQQKAKSLFAALYSRLNAQRDEVMNGIERFSRKQKGMAEQIRDETQQMRELQDKPNADPAQSDELANRLSWQTRIFEDRRKSTSYVCDVPVLIEKRLFDLGTAIQTALNADAPAK
jgi:hypothetical protein